MWVKAKWTGESIVERPEDDWKGGSKVRLSYPDGSVVVGEVSMKASPPRKQNEEVVMARIVTRFAGDTYINVHDADVEVWRSDAFDE